MTEKTGPLSREQWIKRLNDDEMPVFANTARRIAGETSRNERSASALAKLILHDSTMTAKLLRVANSHYYNPTSSKINTVSRAIVVLGFDAVRTICLAITVIDSLVKEENRELILQEVAESFHAAAQARALAVQCQDPSPEEVFIATLLRNLGSLAFWCFSDKIDPDSSKKLKKLLQSGVPAAEAEKEALGFTLNELSAGLNRQWELSPLLNKALQEKNSNDPRLQAINFGHEIATTAYHGWDSDEMEGLQERVADDLLIPIEKVEELGSTSAVEASDAASSLGAGNISRFIPQAIEFGGEGREAQEPLFKTVSTLPEPDMELQLSILQEISELLENKPDVNRLMEMILEGIHRGLGMDRTVLGLMTPQRTELRAKYSMGREQEFMEHNFSFKLHSPPQHIIDYVIKSGKTVWVKEDMDKSLQAYLTPEFTRINSGQECFLLPIILKQKVIGIFYCDRKPSKRKLDGEIFNSLKLFGQQAKMGLALL